MLIRTRKQISESEVTDERHFLNRRKLIQGFAGIGALASMPVSALVSPGEDNLPRYENPHWLTKQFANIPTTNKAQDDLSPYKTAITHNNFYEFGLNKSDPYERAQNFNSDPWKIEITGEVENPTTFYLEDLLKMVDLEERIYRFRCVEAWSMVVPWIGFEFGKLIKQLNPTSKAKYVEFVTLADEKQMPGLRSIWSSIDWPYREGLRMDEALNPLTLLAVGLYGQAMPPQNGAPIRLIVPWKYGFKSVKSIVAIRFRESMPENTWRLTAPNEYGFYANVNPEVDHPRWSQSTERRLPSSLFSPNIIETEMFNGYGDDVAHLYAGMDLSKWY